jgi:hypothetical protein
MRPHVLEAGLTQNLIEHVGLTVWVVHGHADQLVQEEVVVTELTLGLVECSILHLACLPFFI